MNKKQNVANIVLLAGLVFPLVLSAEVKVSLAGPNGEEAREAGVKMTVTRTEEPDGLKSVRVRVVAKEDGERRLRIVATRALLGGETIGYDGHRRITFPQSSATLPLRDAFPMLAAWNGEKGVALALSVETFDSYVDATLDPKALAISVCAAFLKKDQVYETVFHEFDFNAKYGERDAYARFYALYPKRFKRCPAVNPLVNGPAANYNSWRQCDPEPGRFLHATSECCIGASRTWGDPLDLEQPTGPRNTDYSWDEELGYINRAGTYIRKMSGEITRKEFDFHRDERLSYGYYCGVANDYYVMALACISRKIAARHPDSVAVGKVASDGYDYATSVFTFPECSWGREIRRQLKTLSERADISAVYFDVSRPLQPYRGERLKEMTNVSWDKDGPAVIRSIGSAKLFDYIRTNLREKNGGHALGVNINTRFLHLYDIFYADKSEREAQPWAEQKPFPIDRRLAAGEKAFSLWEGFTPDDFDPNFGKWDVADKRLLYSALSRFAVHASFRTGAILPVCFLSEYTALMSHAFMRMDRAGWKPVPGARASGEKWELARYGRGTSSFFTVNNLENRERKAVIEIFSGEVDTDRAGAKAADNLLYVPFYGGAATMRAQGGRLGLQLTVGPQLAGVVEAVGRFAGEGTLAASWTGDFDTETLTVASTDFAGEVTLRETIDTYRLEGPAKRKLAPGGKLIAVYRETVLPEAARKIREATAFGEVRHADDHDSREMALRVIHYFEKVLSKGKAPKAVVDASLAARTLSLGGVTIHDDDRWQLSLLTTRLLDLVNREKHPDYVVPVPKKFEYGSGAADTRGQPTAMPSEDKAYYPHIRL